MNDEAQQGAVLAVRLRSGYGALSEGAAESLEGLHRQISSEWSAASESRRRMLLAASGCLDRLDSFLLQVSRLAEHQDRLLHEQIGGVAGRMPPVGNRIMVFKAADICTDFESLVLHGRAALDRLTLFVTGQHTHPATDRFSRLGNVLKNFGKDEKARQVLELLDEAGEFAGVLTDDGSGALRSLIAHKSGIVEGSRNAFTVHGLGDGRLLIFDCEALGYPVVATSHALASQVPFLVINTLASYLDVDRLDAAAFQPNWENSTAVFSDFVVQEPTDLLLFVCRMQPDGYSQDTQYLRTEVLAKTIELDAPRSSPG